MRTPKHFQALLKAMLEAIPPVMTALMEKGDKKQVGESVMKALAGESGSKPTKPVAMNRDQRLAITAFRHITEIHSSLDRLRDFDTYFRHFPFQKTRVTRHAYLQLMLEAHLNEIYLLRERLVGFARYIGRAYRSDADSKRYAAYATALEKFAVDSLASFTRVRGSHAHQFRYSHDDVDRLSLIAVLENAPDPSFKSTMRTLKREAVTESHARLRTQARTWNKRVAQTVDEYAKAVLPLLFNEKKTDFRYPQLK